MSVTPSPIGGFAGQFFDNNGQPLSGGKIYTYAAGTTTPQASYTNASGATPHANPIILDSAGRVPGGEIWLTDGLIYKFKIDTATDILIGTYDNITGVNSNFVNYTIQEEVIAATAGQTVFNLSTINYTPGTNSLSVYIDGVNQYVGDSYLETDSDTVTFTAGLHVGAEVKFTTAIQTTTGAVDASIVSYDPPFTGGVITTVEDKLAQYISVKDFGAVGDGVADDTAAIQDAIDSSAGFRSIYFPEGIYLVTSQITISDDRVMLYGSAGASRIKFQPTANAVCFLFENGSARSVQNVVRDLFFFSTDTTYTKTAIKLIDVVQCTIENVQTVSPHWFGNGSVFLHILGRDSTRVTKLNVFADKPILISPIPAPHIPDGIGIDHFHFEDLYLANTTSANPLITIEDGVFVTNVTFDGYQAWVGGNHGLYWADTTSTLVSYGVTINNVRWEQPSALGGWAVYISRTGSANNLQDLNIKNLYCAPQSNGVYMRKCNFFVLDNIIYPGVLTAIDLDNTNTFGDLNLVANQNTATITANATRLSGRYLLGGNMTDLAPSGPNSTVVRQIWNPSKTLGFSQLEPKTFTVSASSTVTFSDNSLKGLVFIYADNAGVSSVMAVNGTDNTTKLLVQSDAGQFGTSVGAANYNLYWDAGSSLYKLQVNVAFPITFYVVTMGKGER